MSCSSAKIAESFVPRCYVCGIRPTMAIYYDIHISEFVCLVCQPHLKAAHQLCEQLDAMEGPFQ